MYSIRLNRTGRDHNAKREQTSVSNWNAISCVQCVVCAAFSRYHTLLVWFSFLFYHPRAKVILFPVVYLYLSVCLSVNAITAEPLEISSRNF